MRDIDRFRGHPLSTYPTFSEKLTFLTPRYGHVRVRIRGLEMLVFRKILRTYLMDGPLIILIKFIYQIYYVVKVESLENWRALPYMLKFNTYFEIVKL